MTRIGRISPGNSALSRSALITGLATLLVVGGVWFYVSRADQPTSLTFETKPVTQGTIRRTIATSGPVRALVTVQVGSQLSGQVIELRTDFNSEVKQGDVLAIIDPKTFAVKVAQAKADLSAARATLTNQQAALGKAEAILAQAQRNEERQRQLSRQGIASRALLDTAIRDLEVAKAERRVAAAQIEVAEANVAQREASLLQVEIDLERTQIRAPIDGTIISRTVDQGQTVAASLQAPELFKIAQDLARIRIEAQVNEADVGSIKAGNPASFTVDAYPEQTFAGRVTQVRLAATELQNVVTYTIIIEASNEARRLFPGMTANVEIETARVPDALRLPADALRFRPSADLVAPAANAKERRANAWQRRIEGLTKALALSEAQAAKIRDGLKALASESGGGAGGNEDGDDGGRAALRELFKARFEKLVKSVLDDAQLQRFAEWQKRRAERRQATIWLVGADGRPERRSVQIGVGDENFVEIKRGRLAAGEQVIVRQARKR